MSSTACNNAPVRLNLAGVVDDSIVDGPGIRTTIFAQGCPHGCPGCHNPESHPFGCGTDIFITELARRAKQNPLARGVTFSGGEPFVQAEGFAALARLLRARGFEIACYTGYTLEALLEHGTPAQHALLEQLDILVDGPFLLEQRSLELLFRGSKNQRILDVPQSLTAGKAVWCTQTRWVGSASQG